MKVINNRNYYIKELYKAYPILEQIDNYNKDMKIYFVGRVIADDTFKSRWADVEFRYGGNSSDLNTYSYSRFQTIYNYLGYVYEDIDKENEIYIQNKDEIEKMDKYPNDNSIKIIDNKIFVRLE